MEQTRSWRASMGTHDLAGSLTHDNGHVIPLVVVYSSIREILSDCAMVDCLIHHASGDIANGTRVVEIVSTVGSAFGRRRNFVLPGRSGDAVAHLGCGLAGFVPGGGRGGFTGGGAGGGRGGFAEDGLGYVAGDGDQAAKDGKGGQDPPADELPGVVTPAVRVAAERDVDLGLLLDLGRDVVLRGLQAAFGSGRPAKRRARHTRTAEQGIGDEVTGRFEEVVDGDVDRAVDHVAGALQPAPAVPVQFDIADRVAAAEGVPAAGERVGVQPHIVQRAVVHVAGQELVQAGAVAPESHVVAAGPIETVGVEPVSVVGGPGGLRTGFVRAGELAAVVLAVGGVPVGGLGATILASDGFDVGVVVVAVVAVGGGAVAVVGRLRQPRVVGGQGVRLGDAPAGGFGNQVAGQAEVGVAGGFRRAGSRVGGLRRGALQRVVAVVGRRKGAAGVLAHRCDLVESVVAVCGTDAACGGDRVQPPERVVVVARGDARGDGGDAVPRVVGVAKGVGQVRRVVVGVHEFLDVLGFVAIGVVGVGVLSHRGAVRLCLDLVLRQPV